MTAHARATDPQTSHDAAASITSQSLRASQIDIWWVLTKYGALPDFALIEVYKAEVNAEMVTRQSDSGIRTRRKELTSLGLVRFTGRYAETPGGRSAQVWEAVPQ